YNPERGKLEILVQRGFQKEFLDYFHAVGIEDGSACAQALQSGKRIVIPDVNTDPKFAPHRDLAASTGFRAVQSTPLKTHDGRMLGILSTHFRNAHRLSDRDERLLDLYARHAADLIERFNFEHALKEADRRKDEFLATLAHELRNPLAPIVNGLQLIRLSQNDPKALTEATAIMERQVQQMV
ncbi:MAG TPA: GAF domain-containing protein, partial [Pyrinomonadaceae bacterium]|nr:GAF domain-containing protein [Pyrinomonadaceae bacterium]